MQVDAGACGSMPIVFGEPNLKSAMHAHARARICTGPPLCYIQYIHAGDCGMIRGLADRTRTIGSAYPRRLLPIRPPPHRPAFTAISLQMKTLQEVWQCLHFDTPCHNKGQGYICHTPEFIQSVACNILTG